MKSDSSNSDRIQRTIRVDDSALSDVLNDLDGVHSPAATERRQPRFNYRAKALTIHMQQPGFASPIAYQVPARNISARGLAFLHGGFVHPGTRCVAQLITTYGTWNNVVGSVSRCRYVKGNIHEVIMLFDQEIDPAVYCAEAVQSRVLLAEDDPAIARVAQFHLEQMGAKVEWAKDGKEALEKALSGAFDLLLLDIEMPEKSGFEVVAELRKRGYSGLVCAATAHTQEEDRKRAIDVGCDKYIPKPYTKRDLRDALSSLQQEPLFSTLHDDASMREMIVTFVAELPVQTRMIEQARKDGDLKELANLIRAMKAKGSLYGFDIISEVSTHIESLLLTGKQPADLVKPLDRLLSLCHQARAPLAVGVPAEAAAPTAPAASVAQRGPSAEDPPS